MNNRKGTWGLMIAIAIALAVSIFWAYQFIVFRTTPTIAIVVLGLSPFLAVMIIGAFVSFVSFKLGFAFGRERALKNPPNLGDVVNPFEVKLFGQTLAQRPIDPFLFGIAGDSMDKKNIGRKSFYDDETVRAKMQKWEQQKNTLPAKALSKFLTQEISINPDGSLHVPLETFFLWKKQNPKDSQN
jgi:hypothetical protein